MKAETVADLCVLLMFTYVDIRQDKKFIVSEKPALNLLRATNFEESRQSGDLTPEHAYYLSRRRSYMWIDELRREGSTLKHKVHEKMAQSEAEIVHRVFQVSQQYRDTVESKESKMYAYYLFLGGIPLLMTCAIKFVS
jgi:hypothetical protein